MTTTIPRILLQEEVLEVTIQEMSNQGMEHRHLNLKVPNDLQLKSTSLQKLTILVQQLCDMQLF